MKLTKKTFLTSEAEKLIDRPFSEFGKTTNITSVSNFFEMYNNIFSKIPKRGTNSHASLYERSGNFISNPKTSKDNKIKELNDKIKKLQRKISDLETKNENLSSNNIAQELEIRELKER